MRLIQAAPNETQCYPPIGSVAKPRPAPRDRLCCLELSRESSDGLTHDTYAAAYV